MRKALFEYLLKDGDKLKMILKYLNLTDLMSGLLLKLIKIKTLNVYLVLQL